MRLVCLAVLALAACSGRMGTNRAPGPPSELHFSSVSVGFAHTCGLTDSGLALCWGYGAGGQFGDGIKHNSVTPVAVISAPNFRTLVSGGNNSCGVNADGAAFCWGPEPDAQLRGFAHQSSATPVRTAEGLRLTSLALGFTHSCGLTVSGEAWCWGYGGAGMLGNGSGANSITPVAVSGSLRFTTLTAGNAFTCGVASDAAAYCWGVGSYGRLGDGSSVRVATTPTAVAGGLKFTTLSAGYYHACGVTSTSRAYCWGADSLGELGDGKKGAQSATPVAVEGGLTFVTVSVGSQHSCGVTTRGAAYCWGNNVSGQLGDGTTTQSSVPVAVAGGLTFGSLSSRGARTCGVATSGIVYCWGWATTGAINERSSVPVRLGGSP